MQEGVLVSEPDRARRVLNSGVLVFRWAAYAWMVLSNALASQPLRRPAIAWVALGLAGVWVVSVTVLGRELQPWILWGDLAVSAGLIVLSGFVMHPVGVASGRLLFATSYPASSALAWGAVLSSEVLRLADLAAAHEQQLRTLILREPSEAPAGATSLREALEGAAHQIPEVAVTVNAIGPIWLPATDLDQLMGAVRQALDNVVEHAGASHAAIFSEIDDGWVTVSVRDNGRGFVYTEEQLRAEHKGGMLGSMKGRIEDLGGRMRVHTAPGAGTEVEFRVPLRTPGERPT